MGDGELVMGEIIALYGVFVSHYQLNQYASLMRERLFSTEQ
jgi:hypothetical protein